MPRKRSRPPPERFCLTIPGRQVAGNRGFYFEAIIQGHQSIDLLPRFAEALLRVTPAELDGLSEVPALSLQSTRLGDRKLDLVYAPFDYVNASARIAIVGLTPGARQAKDAIEAWLAATCTGCAPEEALAQAKRTASFSGPMRRNLVAMLDAINVPRLLGIDGCSTLWEGNADLVHFTSVVRYPLFLDGANWSGTPDLLRTEPIRGWFETYAPSEFRQLTSALLIPLGDAVSRALHHLADLGHVRRDCILSGLPHPSGANAERVACFIGTKRPELASSRTDGYGLVASRLRLADVVSGLAGPSSTTL